MAGKMDEVLASAQALVVPTRRQQQEARRVAEAVLAAAVRATRALAPGAEVVLGGSYAKDTWLPHDVDIDVFVKLNPDVGRHGLERQGLRIARRTFRGRQTVLRYAEHPYLEGHVGGLRVNVVPCFRVEPGEWRSAADRSPFHTEFVSQQMTPPLSTQVRLLKQFLRALGAYGAEIAVQGFSGYVCEVLVLHFGSLVETLKAASSFGPRQVIGSAALPPEALERFNSPLVIPDPVDSRRNLGTAISQQRVGSLVLGARRFLARPSLRYFRETPEHAVSASHPLLGSVVGLLFKHGTISVDILWGQLRRTEEFLARQLQLAGYRVLRRAPASDDMHESGIVFLLETLELPRFQVKMGPPVYRQDDTARFVRRNGQAPLLWTDDTGRVLGLVARHLRTAPDLLAALLRAKQAGSGIAPGLYPAIRMSAKVYRGAELVRLGRTRTWLAQCLSRMLRTSGLEFRSG